jgi:hypothetical protein
MISEIASSEWAEFMCAVQLLPAAISRTVGVCSSAQNLDG